MISRSRAVPLGLSVAVVLGFAFRLLHVYASLPEVMASHFDVDGAPNGAQPRASFVLLSLGLSVGTLLVFATMSLWLRRMPAHWINLPNRGYWLAPQRKDAAIECLCRYLDWFALATVFTLVAAFELAIEANLTQTPLRNDLFGVVLGSYLGLVALWSLALVRAFALPIRRS